MARSARIFLRLAGILLALLLLLAGALIFLATTLTAGCRGFRLKSPTATGGI